ncbi:hypothetical protein C4K04_5442 [Pseudomonas chlororaphis]|uniref:Uncharacterized protein n=1 Tax=Pseudomonas chlororaphis TaxID=587753 RepID=A0A3G7TVQ6_9PSED|nr:hypothetical protein C4K04_5442 [Pseudomonas chlororaphis]
MHGLNERARDVPSLGLAEEPLARTDIELICREHPFAAETME